VISHTDLMTAADHAALTQLQAEYQPYAQQWLMTEQGQLDIEQIKQDYRGSARQIQPLLKQQQITRSADTPVVIQQMPYHYVESAQGYQVAGWKFPKRWQFNFYDLLDLLCEQKDWLRIKGICNTDQGCKSFNFNRVQFNYQAVGAAMGYRLEVIDHQSRDWLGLEPALMQCRIDLEK